VQGARRSDPGRSESWTPVRRFRQLLVDDAPAQRFAAAEGGDGYLVRLHRLRGYPLGAFQHDPPLVERQPVEACAVLGGEGLELVQRALLLEHLQIALKGRRGVDHAGAAAPALLQVPMVRRRVRSEKEPWMAGGNYLTQRLPMLLAFQDGQAVQVRPDTSHQHG